MVFDRTLEEVLRQGGKWKLPIMLFYMKNESQRWPKKDSTRQVCLHKY